MDFGSGMTAIVGANGTGKSTILEAVAFAFYGEQRDTRDTLRFYWAEDRGLSVSLEFEFDGRRFIVERKAGDASLKEVFPKEQPWAAGLRPVSKACERLLSLNYEQFKNSFCAEQKGLAFLQFTNKQARQEEVARMLGFHRLKAAEELAFSRRQTLAGQVATLESTIGDPTEAENAKADAEILHRATLTDLGESEKLLAGLAAKLQTSHEVFEKANRWIEITKEMREVGGNAEGLKTSVKLTKTEWEAAEADYKLLLELQPRETEFKRNEQLLKEILRQKEAENQRRLAALEKERLDVEVQELAAKAVALGVPDIAPLHEQSAQLSESVTALEKTVEDLTEAWRAAQLGAQARVSEAKAHFVQAQQALQRAEQALGLGVCAECGQPTGANYVQVVDQRRRELFETEMLLDKATRSASTEKPADLSKAERDRKEAGDRLSAIQKELEAAERLRLQEKGFQDQAVRLMAKSSELAKKIDEQPALYDEKEHQRLEEAQKALVPQHERYLQVQGSEDRLNQRKHAYHLACQNLEAAKHRYRSLDAERKELGFENDEQATLAVSDHNTLLRDLGSAETLVAQKRTQLDMAARALDAAALRLEEVRKRQQELKETKARHALHDHAVKEMRKMRAALNANIGPDLAARASENLSLLTNGRYDTLRLDTDFSAELVEDGVAKAVISGGEEDVVALALRLALSELIQERQGRPMSLLILDEVFGSLDADRRQAVLDRLTALKGRFQQILVISHIEEINQVADQCLYLARDPESRATKVSDAPPHGLGELG
ncbi:MAG TPA: SMC family ATPase [Fimbriimonas sp.]